jgi:hypothetical protein
MEPGIYDISDEQYFGVKAASNSGLKLIRTRSPGHFIHQQRNPKDPTPDMLAGISWHCAILEPESFMDRHAIVPENAPRKPTAPQIKAYKAGKPTEKGEVSCRYWEQWGAMNDGKTIIDTETAAEYLEIGNAIRNHPELSAYFDNGKSEQAVFAHDPKTGVLCKCKPDYLTCLKGYNICLELKSTEDATSKRFQRTALNFGYFQAAAFYQDVMEWAIGRPDLYLIVAFEREAPYGVKVYEVTPEALRRGTEEYRAALNIYHECLMTDNWPLYDTDIEILEYPY